MLYLFLEKKYAFISRRKMVPYNPKPSLIMKTSYQHTNNQYAVHTVLSHTDMRIYSMSPSIDNEAFLLYIIFSQWLTHMCTGQTTQYYDIYF